MAQEPTHITDHNITDHNITDHNIRHHITEGLPANLAAPAVRALTAAGYTRLSALNGASEAALLKLHGIGPNAIRAIKAALAAQGMALSA